MCLLPYGKESSSKTPWNSQEIDLAIFSTIFFSWKFFGLNEKKNETCFFCERQQSTKTRLHNMLDRCCCYGYVCVTFFVCVCVCRCSHLVPRQLWIHSLALWIMMLIKMGQNEVPFSVAHYLLSFRVFETFISHFVRNAWYCLCCCDFNAWVPLFMVAAVATTTVPSHSHIYISTGLNIRKVFVDIQI